MHINTALN